MTPLERELRGLIAVQGPLTVAQFMNAALYHPRYGYYMRRDPLGVAGDFVTAPEISQMFGEIVGAWLADRWLTMNRPGPVALVELGPGRGTLMSDVLRVFRNVPGLYRALSVHLVEISPPLRAIQRRTLAGAQVPVDWHESLDTVPDQWMLLIANEFFDALPVHQFVRTGGDWRERMIAVEGDRLAFALAPGPTPALALLRHLGHDRKPAGAAELSPAGLAIATAIGARIARKGGAALIVDYGDAGRTDPAFTWQAVRDHRHHDPLEAPRSADLSAHVDFGALADAVTTTTAACHGPVGQGGFLTALGLQERVRALSRGADDAAIAKLGLAADRLTGPDQMGELFKVMAVTPAGGDVPPGFAPTITELAG